jgi:hypothetical protein
MVRIIRLICTTSLESRHADLRVKPRTRFGHAKIDTMAPYWPAEPGRREGLGTNDRQNSSSTADGTKDGTSSVAITAATNARVFAADLLQVQQLVTICSS